MSSMFWNQTPATNSSLDQCEDNSNDTAGTDYDYCESRPSSASSQQSWADLGGEVVFGSLALVSPVTRTSLPMETVAQPSPIHAPRNEQAVASNLQDERWTSSTALFEQVTGPFPPPSTTTPAPLHSTPMHPPINYSETHRYEVPCFPIYNQHSPHYGIEAENRMLRAKLLQCNLKIRELRSRTAQQARLQFQTERENQQLVHQLTTYHLCESQSEKVIRTNQEQLSTETSLKSMYRSQVQRLGATQALLKNALVETRNELKAENEVLRQKVGALEQRLRNVNTKIFEITRWDCNTEEQCSRRVEVAASSLPRAASVDPQIPSGVIMPPKRDPITIFQDYPVENAEQYSAAKRRRLYLDFTLPSNHNETEFPEPSSHAIQIYQKRQHSLKHIYRQTSETTDKNNEGPHKNKSDGKKSKAHCVDTTTEEGLEINAAGKDSITPSQPPQEPNSEAAHAAEEKRNFRLYAEAIERHAFASRGQIPYWDDSMAKILAARQHPY